MLRNVTEWMKRKWHEIDVRELRWKLCVNEITELRWKQRVNDIILDNGWKMPLTISLSLDVSFPQVEFKCQALKLHPKLPYHLLGRFCLLECFPPSGGVQVPGTGFTSTCLHLGGQGRNRCHREGRQVWKVVSYSQPCNCAFCVFIFTDICWT